MKEIFGSFMDRL